MVCSSPVALRHVDVVPDTNDSDCMFTVSSYDKSMVLRAGSKQERNEWMAAVLAARHTEIKASLGHAPRSGYDVDVNKVCISQVAVC